MLDNTNGPLSLEEIIEQNGECISSTSGFSMYPMLRHRKDMVVIEKVDRPLKKYDVPLYRMPSGKLVLHRILEVRDDLYVIRGDNLYQKEYIPKEYIIGVLKSFNRNGKQYICNESKAYRAYICFSILSYPLRYFWKKLLRPLLSKIKHLIFK